MLTDKFIRDRAMRKRKLATVNALRESRGTRDLASLVSRVVDATQDACIDALHDAETLRRIGVSTSTACDGSSDTRDKIAHERIRGIAADLDLAVRLDARDETLSTRHGLRHGTRYARDSGDGVIKPLPRDAGSHAVASVKGSATCFATRSDLAQEDPDYATRTEADITSDPMLGARGTDANKIADRRAHLLAIAQTCHTHELRDLARHVAQIPHDPGFIRDLFTTTPNARRKVLCSALRKAGVNV